jgi:hypothetical protein
MGPQASNLGEGIVRLLVGLAALVVVAASEPHARQMIASIADPKNRVRPQQAAFDLNNVRAVIDLMGEYGVVTPPLPAPERFVDASYSRAAAQ